MAHALRRSSKCLERNFMCGAKEATVMLKLLGLCLQDAWTAWSRSGCDAHRSEDASRAQCHQPVGRALGTTMPFRQQNLPPKATCNAAVCGLPERRCLLDEDHKTQAGQTSLPPERSWCVKDREALPIIRHGDICRTGHAEPTDVTKTAFLAHALRRSTNASKGTSCAVPRKPPYLHRC